MTAMPAEHFGLRDRGRLEAGRAADVVVLDLDRLEDGSTLDDPVHYVRGVDHVIVNGTPARELDARLIDPTRPDAAIE